MDSMDQVIDKLEEDLQPVVDKILEKYTPPPKDALKSKEMSKEEARRVLTDFLTGKEIRERLKRGFEVLFKDLVAHESKVDLEEIAKEWVQVIEKLFEEIEKKPEKGLQEEKVQMVSMQDALGISEKLLKHFYQSGVRFFQHQEYQKAADVFFILTTLDCFRPNVWMALGLAERELKHWEPALHAFSMAALTNSDAPWPLAYSAECYLALGQNVDAQECIDAVIEMTQKKSDQESKEVADYALELKNSLKR